MESLLGLLPLGSIKVVIQPQKPAAPTQFTSSQLASSQFASLPAELVLQIAAWLPPRSAVSLSLCNHKLHVLLGRRSLQNLHQSDPYHHEQALLLQALDRDSLESFYCSFCNRLHILSRGHGHRLGVEQMCRRVSDSRCPSADGTYNYGTTTTYHGGFKFEQIQMAMKLYRCGLLSDAKAYLTSLAFLQLARGSMTHYPTNKGLYFFEPRFVKGQISVRAQSCILFQEGQGFMMPYIHYTRACEHLDGNSHRENPYIMVFKCQLGHLVDKQDSCQRSRSLIRCRYCPTEVYVEAKHLNGGYNGGFLIVTKWQALGYGLSPLEAHWKSHLDCPTTLWPYPPDCERGSIRASYEDQPGIKFDSLLKVAQVWKLLNGRV